MLLDQRYQLKEILGQGGAGVVYRAIDLATQRPVAIKYLNAAANGPDRGLERLRREAVLLSRLDHPHIVACYDVGETADHQPYLVLEYVRGCTLRAFLETHPEPLPTEVVLHLMSQVLAALTAAHQAGVVHRDLKPENIMLVGVKPDIPLHPATFRPDIKVMDFGLAYLTGEVRITQDNLVAGTALYLAPEAALGQAVDGRADLYAAGIILYEMLAGHPPFSGNDPLVIISQHLHASPISPRWHNSLVSPSLASLVLKLLAKTPEERYPTAAAVLADLQAVQQSGDTGRLPSKHSLLESIARGRLVGREEEMALLRGAVDNTLRGPGRILFIEGKAGIGKSRLVRETDVYARLKGAQVLTGHCYSADLALPYQPFIEIVKAYTQANIPPGSTGHLPARLAAELVKLAPSLESYFGGLAAPAEEVSPSEARLHLFEAVTTLLTSSIDPVVVILENLHRASPPDLALLQHLVRTGTRNRRLLIIVTYQEHRPPPNLGHALDDLIEQLSEAELAAHLRLQPFSAEKTTALLEALLEGEIAPDFSQAVFRITEGNPFFVEEMLKSLIEEERIFRDPGRGRWEGMNLGRLGVPVSLQEVMSRRFEKLSPTQRYGLNLAALLGRRFRVEALIAAATAPRQAGLEIGPVSEAEVLNVLETATAMQLLHRVPPSETDGTGEMYAFDHSLLRHALLDALSEPRKRRLHRQIGFALETLNEQCKEPVALPDELAYHFSLAGPELKEQAINYSLIAVDHALQVYASEVAVKHYQVILELLDEGDIPRRAWILEQLGNLYFRRTRQIVNAVAAYEGAIQLWYQAEQADTAALIRLYRKMGEISHHWQGHVPKLDVYLAEALYLLDQGPGQAHSLERARILTAMAFNHHAQASTAAAEAQALRLAQTAVELATQLEAANEESVALDALQRIYRAQGDLARAHQIDQRRLALLPRLTDPAEKVDANLGAGHMEWERGDLMAAIKFCREALAIAKQTDNIGGQSEALRRLMMLHLQWGKLNEALNYAHEGVMLGPRTSVLEFGRPIESIFRLHLALLYALQGQSEPAARQLAELKGLYLTPEMPPYRSALGWYYYELQAWDEARTYLEQSPGFPPPFLPVRFDLIFLIEIYGQLGDGVALRKINQAAEAEVQRWQMPYLTSILRRGWGIFYAGQARWEEAEAAFKQALAATHRQTFWYQDARTWLEYGRMLARRNQPGDAGLAQELLNEAQSMFLSFGAQALAEKAWVEATRLSQSG